MPCHAGGEDNSSPRLLLAHCLLRSRISSIQWLTSVSFSDELIGLANGTGKIPPLCAAKFLVELPITLFTAARIENRPDRELIIAATAQVRSSALLGEKSVLPTGPRHYCRFLAELFFHIPRRGRDLGEFKTSTPPLFRVEALQAQRARSTRARRRVREISVLRIRSGLKG
jgi:hypothetical protein